TSLLTLPIRLRILSIAAVNAIVVIIFAAVIWDVARMLTSARNDLRLTRASERLLTLLESQAGQLQNLIHRYIAQPNADLLNAITRLRETVLSTLKDRASADPILAGSAEELSAATERFVAGFGDLRLVQTAITNT